MLTHEQLARIQHECDVELQIAPDTAEALEDCADRLHARAASLRLEARAANETELVSTQHIGALDRIAAALNVMLVEQTLSGLLLGIYIPDLEAIVLHTPLRALVRQTTLAHEEAHVARRNAGHDEVWYLALALMVPRSIALRAERLGEGAVMQVCPWQVPYWVLAKRVALLRAITG
jgi:hypothetical protein